jgi:hypothetical protein
MSYFGLRRNMMKDERVQATMRRIATQTFGIWYVLLLAALLYRQFYLGQSLKQYWDIALIFLLGTTYASVAIFAQGAVYKNSMVKSFKWVAPILPITIVVVAYLKGGISTIWELVETFVAATVGFAVVGILFYFLYRRWERSIQ